MDTVHFILVLLIVFVLLFNLYLYYNDKTYEGLEQPGLQWFYSQGYCENQGNWNGNNIAQWANWAINNRRNAGNTTNLANLSTITNNYVIQDNRKPDDQFSLFIQGYFVPNVSGRWNFWTNSDDCCYVWINVPFNQMTIGNCTVNNGGAHPMWVRTGGIDLVANRSYPIYIIFGERGGGYDLQVQVQPPNGSWTSNLSGYVFVSQPPPADTTIYISGQTTVG